LTQLNKYVILFTVFFLPAMLFGCAISQDQLDDNSDLLKKDNLANMVAVEIYNSGILENESDIMLDLQDGNSDSLINEIYSEDIFNVENITFSKWIIIEYHDCDLNSDGITDKIVTIRSPLHSGSSGCTIDFLIGNSDGTYRQISGLHARLYAQSEDYNNASMYILNSKTNDYHDILIHDNGESAHYERSIVLLKYDNGRYWPSK